MLAVQEVQQCVDLAIIRRAQRSFVHDFKARCAVENVPAHNGRRELSCISLRRRKPKLNQMMPDKKRSPIEAAIR